MANTMVHTATRNARRVRGRAQIHRVEASGVAPTKVLAALKKAQLGRGEAAERAAITRIEQLRSLLMSSDEPLTEGGLGASGTTHAPTLGSMALSSKPAQWAYLLFRLVRELSPQNCLELGSCVGVSGAYQAAALKLNGSGRLITLEGAPVLAQRTARTIEELGLQSVAEVRTGYFADTLGGALADLAPVDYAFIDGHHDCDATLDYANAILGGVADEALLVFDDINWSAGMQRAWTKIVADERFALTVDLRSVGLAVVSASALGQQSLKISYY